MRFLLFISCLLALQACRINRPSVDLSNMRDHQQLFYYSLIEGSLDERIFPPVGAEVRINYRMLKDSIVLDESYSNFHPTLVQIPSDQYDNFFTKALKIMAIGDSLRVHVQAQKVPDMLGEYADRFEAKDWVTFDFKLYEQIDEAKMNLQIQIEQQFLDSLRIALPAKIQAFAEGDKNNLEQTAAGIFYQVYDNGIGLKAQKGDAVSVHYLCFSSTGIMVDDSYRNMVPMRFEVGNPGLIMGFSESVKLLNEGSRGLFFIPAELAYGQLGNGGAIAPNSYIVFYVEMMEIN